MITAAQSSVSGLVPFLHVGDLERSIAFYERLGFSVANGMEKDGRRFWVMLEQEGVRLMLARADAPVDRHAQGALFYLYTADLESYRAHLTDAGIPAGEIGFPDHMPGGELRVDDPDGYCLMIGQLATRP